MVNSTNLHYALLSSFLLCLSSKIRMFSQHCVLSSFIMYSSFNVVNQALHLYQRMCKVMLLYVLICPFLCMMWEVHKILNFIFPNIICIVQFWLIILTLGILTLTHFWKAYYFFILCTLYNIEAILSSLCDQFLIILLTSV